MFNKISVVGLGYIGLPTAAMFASNGINVIGVDVQPAIVDSVNSGKAHFSEPGLQKILLDSVEGGFLHATTSVEEADAFLIAVPTPFTEALEPDLSFLKSAAENVAQVLKKGDLVVLESTVPVGATEELCSWLAHTRPDLNFPSSESCVPDVNVAHCPERVLPGKMIDELINNDRVIGGMTRVCAMKAEELYRVFVKGTSTLTNARTAEMVKLTENASRDVGIAFANEVSLICDRLGVDVWELISIANKHPRVNVLQPGPGVGGHCIAVDPWFIVSAAPAESKLIRTAREINDFKPAWVLEKIKTAISDFLIRNPNRSAESVRVGCFGLSFKADVDDLRESPALNIVSVLCEDLPGQILVVEPNLATLPESFQGKAILETVDEALNSSDILVLLVNHSQFRSIDVRHIDERNIIDTRGSWSAYR